MQRERQVDLEPRNLKITPRYLRVWILNLSESGFTLLVYSLLHETGRWDRGDHGVTRRTNHGGGTNGRTSWCWRWVRIRERVTLLTGWQDVHGNELSGAHRIRPCPGSCRTTFLSTSTSDAAIEQGRADTETDQNP